MIEHGERVRLHAYGLRAPGRRRPASPNLIAGMRRSLIVLLAAVAASLVAASAQAGTYEVRACSAPGAKYPNQSWTFWVPNGNWTTESTCPASKPELVLLMPPTPRRGPAARRG